MSEYLSLLDGDGFGENKIARLSGIDDDAVARRETQSFRRFSSISLVRLGFFTNRLALGKHFTTGFTVYLLE